MVIRHEEKKWRGKNRAPWKNTKNFKHVKVLTCASLILGMLVDLRQIIDDIELGDFIDSSQNQEFLT